MGLSKSLRTNARGEPGFPAGNGENRLEVRARIRVGAGGFAWLVGGRATWRQIQCACGTNGGW